MTIFPSYYEPGATLSRAWLFRFLPSPPPIGLGARSAEHPPGSKQHRVGLFLVRRNYNEVVEEIAEAILDFSLMSAEQVNLLKRNATRLSDRADWSHFIAHYLEAYSKALHHSFIRLSKPYKLKAD